MADFNGYSGYGSDWYNAHPGMEQVTPTWSSQPTLGGWGSVAGQMLGGTYAGGGRTADQQLLRDRQAYDMWQQQNQTEAERLAAAQRAYEYQAAQQQKYMGQAARYQGNYNKAAQYPQAAQQWYSRYGGNTIDTGHYFRGRPVQNTWAQAAMPQQGVNFWNTFGENGQPLWTGNVNTNNINPSARPGAVVRQSINNMKPAR